VKANDFTVKRERVLSSTIFYKKIRL
jgi:hypothetical protein